MEGTPAEALEKALDMLRETIPNCTGVVVVAAVDDGDTDYVRYLTGSALPVDKNRQIKTPKDITDAMLAILRPAVAVMESDMTERVPVKTESGQVNANLLPHLKILH